MAGHRARHRTRRAGNAGITRSALALAALSFAGCGNEPEDPFLLPSDTPVVLIVIDTLRADHLGCYGYPLDTSPVIDAFASQATLFERNSTQFNSTFPSLTSIFTGLYPKTHGNYFAVPLEGSANESAGALCLAERFGARGYATLAVLSHPSFEELDRNLALMRGWDAFSTIGTERPVAGRPLLAHQVWTNERAFALIDEWEESGDGEPLFLWVHYFDPHTDLDQLIYNPPPETRDRYLAQHLERAGLSQLEAELLPLAPRERTLLVRERYGPGSSADLAVGRSLYDAEIRWCDAGIGRLFDRLREVDAYDRALIVVMSDHGENLGAPEAGHGPIQFTHLELFEAVAHTPLIVKLPGQVEGRRVDALTQNIDLAPTLMELFDLPAHPPVEGKSLVPLLRDPEADVHERVFIESSKGGVKAVRQSDVKLIDRGDELHPLVFDLAADPAESKSLHAELDAGRFAELVQAIDDFRPWHTLRLRLEPGASPWRAAIRIEQPTASFRDVVGADPSSLSADGSRFEFEFEVEDEPVDLLLFPRKRYAETRFRIVHSGAERPEEAVRIGDTPVHATPAIRLLRPGAAAAAAEPLLSIVREPAGESGDGDRLVIEARPPEGSELELGLRYARSSYDKDFRLLEDGGLGPLERVRGRTYRLVVRGPDLARGTLAYDAADGDLLTLVRLDGRWPDPRRIAIDGHAVEVGALEFVLPHPPDGTLTELLGRRPADAPPGSVTIWMESASGEVVIDPASLDPELYEQLRTLGYVK